MNTQAHPADRWDASLQEFDRNGFVVIPDALSVAQVRDFKLKLGSTQRRTLHLYYERYGGPRTNEWTQIPPRLSMKHDPSLPPYLYAKAQVRETIDGTGRKPRDVPPGMTTARMLLHVQRRANQPVVAS